MHIGEILEMGIECEKDKRAAWLKYKKAADAGVVDGMRKIANWRRLGVGCKKNPQMAFRMFIDLVTKHNDVESLAYVGRMTCEGEGTTKRAQEGNTLVMYAENHGSKVAKTWLNSRKHQNSGV
jgi:TPR repeat protein